MQWDKALSYLVTLSCFVISVRAAFAFFVDKPRLFSAISMFALSWAILLPYYGSDVRSEMLPAFNGFLLGYVGALLIDETRTRQRANDREMKVDRRMKETLWLLLLVIIPSLHEFGIEIEIPIKIPNWNIYKTEILINLLITVVSYWILADGLLRFSNSTNDPNPKIYWSVTIAVLIVYFCSSLYFGWLIFFGPELPETSSGKFWSDPSIPPMTTAFRIVFAVLKSALTVLFLQILIWTETPKEKRTSETAFEYVAQIAKFWRQGEL